MNTNNHNINHINHNNSNGYIDNKKRITTSYIPHRQLHLSNPKQKNNRNFISSFNNIS